MDTGGLQSSDNQLGIAGASPILDELVQSFFVLLSISKTVEAGIAKQLELARGAAEAGPFLFIPATDYTPASLPARIAAVGRGCGFTIPVAHAVNSIAPITEQRSAHELQSCLVLRKIKVEWVLPTAAIVERRKDGHPAENHGHKIDIGAIDEIGRA